MSEPHFRPRLWGYDRAQVDAFVERTASRLSAAEAPVTPDGAVRETIDRVSAEINGVLRHAYELAAEVRATAQQEAAEVTSRAEEEAAELTAAAQRDAAEITQRSQHAAAELQRQAEARAAEIVREADARADALDAEIVSLGQERESLLADIERISQRLHALVSQAGEQPEADWGSGDGTEEPARAVPARLAAQASVTDEPVTDEPATAELPGAVVARDRTGAET